MSESFNCVEMCGRDFEKLKSWSNHIIPERHLACTSVLDKNGNLVGAGYIELVGEATIILKPELSKLDKAEIIRKLFPLAQNVIVDCGIRKLVVFTDDKLYARFLEKRFGFDQDSGLGLQLRF